MFRSCYLQIFISGECHYFKEAMGTQLLCDYTKIVVGEIRTAHSEKILGFGTLLNIYSLAETGT